MKKEEYPQAFPVSPHTYGMSLRDYFAGIALMRDIGQLLEFDELARECYAIADAMLKERLK